MAITPFQKPTKGKRELWYILSLILIPIVISGILFKILKAPIPKETTAVPPKPILESKDKVIFEKLKTTSESLSFKNLAFPRSSLFPKEEELKAKPKGRANPFKIP